MSNEEHEQNIPPSNAGATEDDQIAAAMALLQESAPAEASDGPPEPEDLEPATPQPFEAPQGPTSPTLDALEPNRRPQAPTVCETCPNSVWFSSPEEVKCYCRVMYLIVWESSKPNVITGCDGVFIGQEE